MGEEPKSVHNRIVKRMKSKGSFEKTGLNIMPLASFVCSGSPGVGWLEDGIKEVGLGILLE